MKRILLASLFLVAATMPSFAQRFVETKATLEELLAMDPHNKNSVWFVPGSYVLRDGGEGIYVYDPDATDPIVPGGNVFEPTGPYGGRWFRFSLVNLGGGGGLTPPVDAANLANGSVSNTEFQYLDGLLGPIQAQIDSKLPATPGISATLLANGSVNNTEFQSLDGISGNIQGLFDTKLSLTGGTITGPVIFLARLTATNVDLTLDEFIVDNFIVEGGIFASLVAPDAITLGGVTRTTWPALSGDYQPASLALTNLSSNPSMYQATNSVLTRLQGIGLGLTGYMIYHDGVGWTNLPPSADGTVLKLASGKPSWGTDNTGTNGTTTVTLSTGPTTYVDVSDRADTNYVTGNMTFAHATNGVAGEEWTHRRWLLNSTTNAYTLTIPSGWNTNKTQVIPGLTNQTATRMTVTALGPTDTSARQTNVFVEFTYFSLPAPPAAGTLTNGLVAYWSMDESANGTAQVARVDPVNGENLSDPATAGATTGKIGNAVQLNEGGVAELEYLTHTDDANLSGGTAGFTISAWVYCTTFITNLTVASKFDWGSTDQEWAVRIDISNGLLGFRATPDGTSASTVGVAESNFGSITNHLNEWIFVVAWHDPSANEIGISVNNGTPVTAAYTTDAIFDSTKAFYVGRTGNAGTGLAEYWRGNIDEVGFWKRALNSAERTALWNGGAGDNPLTP